MATRTSSQSGNFNATSTWGGSAVPVDGDQFVVAAGHIVTVNDDRRTTNGYHNSTISGKLHITGSGKLRMNGQLDITSTGSSGYFTSGDSTTGAYFRMDNGAVLEIKGSNSDNHSLRFNAQKYNWIEVEGTNPNQKTTLTATTSIASTSLSVASGTGFAKGDWIAINRAFEDIADWEYDRFQDEGMIIHDISGNTIYPRWFVSPTAEITKVRNAFVFVDDSRVFRKGQKITFGTGSNRNVRTINAINHNLNRITVNSNPTGSVIGEKIYRAGTEIHHDDGADVQKIATPLTADAASGQAVITVASTAGMAVGKRILIEANNTADTNWDYEMLYTISSISGNNVTLTSNLANARLEGGWVTIYDRDTKIISTDVGNSAERPYIYFIRWTSGDAYYRRVRLRNCLFEGMGSNTTNGTWYRGVGWSGYMSFETSSYGQYASGMEGCVFRPNNRGNSSSMYMRDGHQVTQRNCIAYDATLNFWRYAGGNNFSMTNNISWRSNYCTFLQDGAYEPQMFICYNHFARSDDYGSLWYHNRDASGNVRHNYWVHHEQRPFYIFYHSHNIIFENNYIEHFRTWPYIGAGGDVIWLNCYINSGRDATSGVTTPISGVQIQNLGNLRSDRQNQPQLMYSINHQWKEGETVRWGMYSWAIWDEDESAWKTFHDGANNGPSGHFQSILVPAGSTVYLAGEVKMSSGFSGNRPYLYARSAQGYRRGQHYNGTSTSDQRSEAVADGYPYGHAEYAQFTSAADSAFERKTLTISPTNYDYYLSFGIYGNNANMGDGLEHWHERPVEVYIDKPASVVEKKYNTHLQVRKGINTSATRKKRRLGGRLK